MDRFVGVEQVDPSLFTNANIASCPAGRRCRYSDAAFISKLQTETSARGAVAQATNGNPAWNGTSMYTIDAKGNALMFQTVNKIGRTSGRTSGNVDTTCASVNVAGVNITLLCQWLADIPVFSGDSGSPVLGNPSGGFRTLYGIIWGGSSTRGVFSPMSGVQRSGTELGPLRVCFGGASC